MKPDFHNKSIKYKVKFNIDFGILFKSHKSLFIQKQKLISFNELFEV